jgi:hypothetical protein
MIINVLPPEKIRDEFGWASIEWWQYMFCTVQRVDYIYEPFMTINVDSFDSLRNALHAIEEEALMYMVNETARGKSAEIKDLIPDNDLVIISKHTDISLVNQLYAPSVLQCWHRMFEHEGDLYDDTDLVLRHGMVLDDKIPIAVKIDNLPGECELGNMGSAVISAVIVESDASKLNFETHTIHRLKPDNDKKASTLDILLGMQ